MSHHRWTREEIVVALQRYADLIGETPSYNRVNRDKEHLPWLPWGQQIRNSFGTFNAAIEAAGLEPRSPRS